MSYVVCDQRRCRCRRHKPPLGGAPARRFERLKRGLEPRGSPRSTLMYGANAPVEVTGFEPAISWSQARRDSQTTPHLDVRDLKLKRLNDRRDQLFNSSSFSTFTHLQVARPGLEPGLRRSKRLVISNFTSKPSCVRSSDRPK